VLDVYAVGLHESRQVGNMGQVAFRTGELVLNRRVGGLPSLDRFMNAVFAFPCMIGAVCEGVFWMAFQAETGKFRVVFNYRASGSEGILVDIDVGYPWR
jgi:hypothetical protein